MAKDFTVTSKHFQSRMEWLRTYGTTSLPVKSFTPRLTLLPEADEPELVFYLDLDCLSEPQQHRLMQHLASRFNLPLEQVIQNVKNLGVPIPAVDCVLTINNPHKWLEEI